MQGSPSRPPLTGSSSMEIRLAEGQGRYQSPGGGTATAGPSGGPGGSPTSDGVRTEDSDAAEYSENARLVGAALSDDGMTPLIQVRVCVGAVPGSAARVRRLRQRFARGTTCREWFGHATMQQVAGLAVQQGIVQLLCHTPLLPTPLRACSRRAPAQRSCGCFASAC
jgi:hypothetical protein